MLQLEFPFCVCVNVHIHACVQCYLCTHLCQPETASCCPTLLLPWWTPLGLQQAHRCVRVCVFSCVKLHVLLFEKCVRMRICTPPFGSPFAGCVYVGLYACQPVLHWVFESSVCRQMREHGCDDSEVVGGRGPRPVLVGLFIFHVPGSLSSVFYIFLYSHPVMITIKAEPNTTEPSIKSGLICHTVDGQLWQTRCYWPLQQTWLSRNPTKTCLLSGANYSNWAASQPRTPLWTGL